jgi:hypothetical protein
MVAVWFFYKGYKMGIELLKINTDTDGRGLTILRRRYETINGVKYYAQAERESFRQVTINESGESILNVNFSQQIDDFTGVTNFLTTFYNF